MKGAWVATCLRVYRGIGVLLLLAVSGCQAGYYWHLARGHMQLMRQAEPVEVLLQQGTLSDHERQQLQLAQRLRAFAEETLALPVGETYSQYVALDRDWVVLALLAAPPFSLESQSWCFPVIGCAHYRGFYQRARAEKAAQALSEKGLEVYLSGVVAYSTLGWFDDPLTTPMLHHDASALAELVFHELVHKRIYIKHDTAFNESLATAVAREGVRQWAHVQLPAAQRHSVVRDMQQRHARQRWFVDQVKALRQALAAVYAEPISDAAKHQQKQKLIEQARDRFQAALATHPERAVYQGWFAQPLNNAQLAAVALYHDWVPAFEALLERHRLPSGNVAWAAFYDDVGKLGKQPASQRGQALAELAASSALPEPQKTSNRLMEPHD